VKTLQLLWETISGAPVWLIRGSAQRPRLLQFAIITAVLVAAVWSAATFLQGYLTDLGSNRQWINDLNIAPQDRMLRVIFERSLEADLIWSTMAPDGVRVRHVSCENSRKDLGPDGVGERGDKAQANKQALTLLCTTEHGAQIREEIRQWNDSEWIVAVRDDRRKQPPTSKVPVSLQCDEPALRQRTGASPRPRTALATIPRKCLLNRWKTFTLAGDREIAIDSRTLEPSPQDYNFIASDGPRYMSDWASLMPIANIGPLRDLDFRLRSDVTLPADGMVRIDLVGVARQVTAGQAQLNLMQTPPNARAPTTTARADRTAINVRVRCDANSMRNGDCTHLTASPNKPIPFAYTIEIRGRPGQTIPIAIDARMQHNLPRSLVQSLADTQSSAPATNADDDDDPDEEGETDETAEWQVGTRTQNLVVACPEEAEAAGVTPCKVSWREAVEEEKESDAPDDGKDDKATKGNSRGGNARGQEKSPGQVKPRFQVAMAEDKQRTNLVEPGTGEFTANALELGLAPLIGGGVSQWGSLARAIRGTKSSGGSALLSIDPDAQRIVTSVLEERRTRCGPTGPRDCLFRHPGARASIVLIDASKERAGEIRAMASWPAGQTGSHVWDLAAGGGAGRAWRTKAISPAAWRIGYDGYSQPGSTFKVVTALAAIETALAGTAPEAARIGQLLRGDLNAAEMARYLGLRTRVPVPKTQRSRSCNALPGSAPDEVNMLYIQRRDPNRFACLQNFESIRNRAYFVPVVASHCPRGRSAQPEQLGLCEALMKSSNLFFGGLALKLDQSKVVTSLGERTETISDLALSMMANRLTPDRRDKPYDLMRGGLPQQAPALFLDRRPVMIDNTLADPPPPKALPDRKVMAATSGYGQNVYASPLAMASIYASIGAGLIVRPRLLPRESPEKTADDPDEGMPLLRAGTPADRAAYLKILRDGLHAVVASSGGSTSAFRSGGARGPRGGQAPQLIKLGSEARLFGKTGTAKISSHYNTVWFAGWIEARPGGIPRRLAFACQAIQQPVGKKLTGGAVCAPIIRDILLKLDQQVR
jgi:cell division protein FtsI/penicillin-binding protein 2